MGLVSRRRRRQQKFRRQEVIGKQIPREKSPPLFCLASTAECALDGCVACAHKVVQDKEALPRANVRPEQCKRFGRVECTSLFAGCRVLTVGDGDLSFSVALKRSGCDVDASTLAVDAEDLIQRYPTSAIREHVAEIGSVLFGVDATRLPRRRRYDRIIFNFPCVDVAGGADCQNPDTGKIDQGAVSANQKLVADFVASAKGILTKYGEVIITHKTKPPYCWWNLPKIVVEDLRWRGSLVFDRVAFPPYVNKKAKSPKSFSASDARMYVFSPRSSSPCPAADRMRGTVMNKRHLLRRISPSLFCAVRNALLNSTH